MRRFLLLTGTIGRARYLQVGVLLFLVKYALDWSVARGFGRTWSPLNYLIWPDRDSFDVLSLPQADRQFGLILLAMALPFIWIGVTLTLQRLRDAQLPLALILLFFIPLVNLLLIAGLCLVPSKPPMPEATPVRPVARRVRRAHSRVAGQSAFGSFCLAVAISVTLTVGFVYFCIQVFQSYGYGVFVASPFALGWLAAVIHGIPRKRSAGQCLAVAMVALAVAGIVLLAIAFEGVICILMAAPIGLGLAILGGLVGFAVQTRPWANDSVPSLIIGLIVMMPALMAAESAGSREPEIRAVRTEVIVNASPEAVWPLVVAFPPLSEPGEWYFRTGIAYPQRAEIRGRGVGAVRHCVFSTGAFVEPIDVWDEPHCLAFRVTDQPPPMEELSPFHIHPPHLDNFLVSRRGQFRLERLSDGRTRLEGTTWYTNRMWPADYWHVWSDAIIGRIHERVLDHVKGLAEAPHK